MEPLLTNHISTNIITKGWLNISAITKGFILPTFQYVIKKRKTGGSPPYWEEEMREQQHLIDDLKKAQEKGEEIEFIQVFVNWDKQPFKYGKKVYAELIKKKVEAEISTALSQSHTIKVELITNNEIEDKPKKRGRPRKN